MHSWRGPAGELSCSWGFVPLQSCWPRPRLSSRLLHRPLHQLERAVHLRGRSCGRLRGVRAHFPAPMVLHLSKQGIATTQWCGAAKALLRPRLGRMVLQAAQHIKQAGRTRPLPASSQHRKSSGTQMQVQGRHLHPVCTIIPLNCLLRTVCGPASASLTAAVGSVGTGWKSDGSPALLVNAVSPLQVLCRSCKGAVLQGSHLTAVQQCVCSQGWTWSCSQRLRRRWPI